MNRGEKEGEGWEKWVNALEIWLFGRRVGLVSLYKCLQGTFSQKVIIKAVLSQNQIFGWCLQQYSPVNKIRMTLLLLLGQSEELWGRGQGLLKHYKEAAIDQCLLENSF